MARIYMPLRPTTRGRRVVICLIPPTVRFFLTCIIATIIAVVSLEVYNTPPRHYTYSDIVINWSYDPVVTGGFLPWDRGFAYTALFDPHAHTTYSDGSLTPQQLIDFHIANGFNVLAVTDHNTIAGAVVAQQIAQQAKYRNKITVIVGEEWSNCRVHINFLGITKEIPAMPYPTDDDIVAAIKNAHDQGGVVVYNHRPWSHFAGLDQPSREQLARWGVDYFDVTTGDVLDLQTLLWARSEGLGVLAGDDVHGGGPVNAWTLLNVNHTSGMPPAAHDVIAVLKADNQAVSFLFDAIGSPYSVENSVQVNPQYTAMTPFLLLGGLFHSFYSYVHTGPYSFTSIGTCGPAVTTIYWHEIWACFGWFLLVFVVCEVIRFGLRLVSNLCCPRVASVVTGDNPPLRVNDELFTPLTVMDT